MKCDSRTTLSPSAQTRQPHGSARLRRPCLPRCLFRITSAALLIIRRILYLNLIVYAHIIEYFAPGVKAEVRTFGEKLQNSTGDFVGFGKKFPSEPVLCRENGRNGRPEKSGRAAGRFLRYNTRVAFRLAGMLNSMESAGRERLSVIRNRESSR